jgi:Fur family ferric uptake transcriptional regulator
MPHCQTLLQTLRQRGYRITPQREMILEAFAHSVDHVTAEQLFTSVSQRTRSINIATVYRTLNILVDEGLATRVDLRDGQVIYTTSRHGEHIHLICRHCGVIIKAEHQFVDSLGSQLFNEYKFSADLEHISFTGVCAHCRKKSVVQ